MHNRPSFLTHDSIRSRDLSDPQAYRLSNKIQPHEATTSSKRASKMASILKNESAPTRAPAQSKGATYKPGVWLWMAFATLGILTIMVALDATALSVALPVRDSLDPVDEERILNKLVRSLQKSSTAAHSKPSGPQRRTCSPPPSSNQPLHPFPMSSGEDGSQRYQSSCSW